MKKSFIWSLLFSVVAAFASIPPQMEGMDVVYRPDGTFLVGSPTFYFDRILGAGGLHSESEMWSPQKIRQRILLNRMSAIPSWDIAEPSLWFKTGNELGDMIYNDMIASEREDNRTPILEGGFRTPSFKGFWATARFFQDDTYSEYSDHVRREYVQDEFALFGENYPMLSAVYGGLGFTNSFINASLLVGEEYLWIQGKSFFWIPVHYKPRIEGRADFAGFSLTAVYEDAEFQNERNSRSGSRKEVNGSVYYQCAFCKESMIQASAGVQFRATEDSGYVYSKLDGGLVVLPFLELHLQPLQNLEVHATFAANDQDWLVQDSVELNLPVAKQMNLGLGVKNISGTRLNPLGETEEYSYGDTISLWADGQMNLIQGYASLVDTIQSFSLGLRGSFWAEHGAETFEVKGDTSDKIRMHREIYFRYGDVSRINQWIYGFTAELKLNAWYEDWFNFSAMAGYEHISGPVNQAEVTPAEFYTAFSADWLFRKTLLITHSLHYRSDARWNFVPTGPLVAKGDWYWEASFQQQFPRQKLYLTGTLLHTLGDELIESPNANSGRVRFICTLKKMF